MKPPLSPVLCSTNPRRRRATTVAAVPLALLLGAFGPFAAPGSARAAPGFTASFLSFDTGDGPLSVAIGDLNADGRVDVVVADQLSNTVSVLLGVGDGTF